MNWLLEPFELANMQRALVAAVLIGFGNGFTSAYIVLRKSALKMGSLSHSILPGIALAVLLFGLTPLNAFTGALFGALLVGLGSIAVSNSSRLHSDTALAVLFTAAFAAGIVLLHYMDNTAELQHWLFGEILGMADADLYIVFIITVAAVLFLALFQRPIIVTLFEPHVAASLGIPVRLLSYTLFTLAILVLVSSLQAVGCILALGMLVSPAATVSMFSDSPQSLFWGGGLVGALGSAAALVAAYWLDLPAGATIVLTLGLLFALAYSLSPKYGLLRFLLRPRHAHGEGKG